MEPTKVAYVWMPEINKIAEFNVRSVLLIPKEFMGKYCVDDNSVYEETNRFGMWVPTIGDHHISANWKYIPFEEFPIEFKTNLLLLGITA